MVIKEIENLKKKNLINLKISENELQEIKKKADKYTNGNLSAWLRYAAIKFNPTQGQIKS